jgi:hypothetical protein
MKLTSSTIEVTVGDLTIVFLLPVRNGRDFSMTFVGGPRICTGAGMP